MARENTLIKPTKLYNDPRTLKIHVAKAVPENWAYHIAYNADGRCYPIFMGAEALPVARRGFIVIGG